MYYFKVKYWDSTGDKEEYDCGLVTAPNYGEAAEKIVKFYGKENIMYVTFECWGEDRILLKDEIIEGLDNGDC